MVITYVFEDSLYVNVTNRCTCACTFCLRQKTDGVGDGENLWLEREPTKKEILEDIQKRDLSKYKELVFCGFGEPTLRLKDILWVCERVRGISNIHIRINTNGHASLIQREETAKLFSGLVDSVSISLNAKDADDYVRLCRPEQGTRAFYAMLDFAASVKEYVPEVTLTVLDILPEDDIEECRKIAEELGVGFRVRKYIIGDGEQPPAGGNSL